MIAIIVLVFQTIAVLFIGIFGRSNDSNTLATSLGPLFNNCIMLMLAFIFMVAPFRNFSLFSLVTLLLVIAIAAQTNFLFGTFWDSCFAGFSSTFTVNLTLIIRSLFASLSVLLTALDFIGLFTFWQIYLFIVPIMTIGFALCSGILLKGLGIFDGGGGLLVFLYSGICSLLIWAISLRGKIDIRRYKIKQSYLNNTLCLIGIVLAFINWPKFNMAGAIVSFGNVYTPTLVSSGYLQNSALGNTFAGLSCALLVSMLFVSRQIKQQKMRIKIYVDCFLNTGIVMASFQDISLDPVVAMIMGVTATIITLLIHKYFIAQADTSSQDTFKIIAIHYSKIIYRIFFSLIGIIICSIVVAARSGKIPQLLNNNYSRIAGLEIVAMIIVVIFALIFGAISGFCINIYIAYRKGNDKQVDQSGQIMFNQLTDNHYFQKLQDQRFPLYYDIFKNINLNEQEEQSDIQKYSARVIKESLLGAQQQPLKILTVTKNRPVTRRENAPQQIVINKNYSKSAFNDGDSINVSKMKQLPSKQKKENEYQQYVAANKSLADRNAGNRKPDESNADDNSLQNYV